MKQEISNKNINKYIIHHSKATFCQFYVLRYFLKCASLILVANPDSVFQNLNCLPKQHFLCIHHIDAFRSVSQLAGQNLYLVPNWVTHFSFL